MKPSVYNIFHFNDYILRLALHAALRLGRMIERRHTRRETPAQTQTPRRERKARAYHITI
jgi:hypothetical protein